LLRYVSAIPDAAVTVALGIAASLAIALGVPAYGKAGGSLTWCFGGKASHSMRVKPGDQDHNDTLVGDEP